MNIRTNGLFVPRIRCCPSWAAAVAAFSIGTAAYGAAPAPSPSYHAVGHYRVASSAGGDLKVDAAARKIYAIAGNSVLVLDADSGATTATISPTPGASALAVVPALGRGFSANAGDGSVTIFDLKTNAVVKAVAVGGKNLSALYYDASLKRVFVASEDGTLAAIDATSGAVTGTVKLGGKLAGLIGNDYGQVYVSAEDQNVLHVVDSQSLAFLGDDPVAPGVGPRGLGIDPVGRRIFVACANGKIPVIDTDAGVVFSVSQAGAGTSAILFDRTKVAPPKGDAPWKGQVLASAPDGSLTVMKMNAFISYTYHDTVKITEGARAVAFDSKANHVLVSLPNEILVLGR